MSCIPGKTQESRAMLKPAFRVLVFLGVGLTTSAQRASCSGGGFVAGLNEPCPESAECEEPSDCLTLPDAAEPTCEVSCNTDTDCPDWSDGGRRVPSYCQPVGCPDESDPNDCATWYCMGLNVNMRVEVPQ
jgi:hypothetical protein